jgi:DNA-directed RNA polymerase specialized sigma24 family protein
VRASEGASDEELVARLYEALAALPPAERAAAVVAFGLGEGHTGVAEELGIDAEDADALTRNALQLLRGALGDVDLDDPVYFGRLERRRGHRTGHHHDSQE